MTPTALAEPLDAYLAQVVQTLQTAVSRGMRHAADQEAGPQIADCEEILGVIMRGDVADWLA